MDRGEGVVGVAGTGSVVLDAKGLRAMAHPVRVRLVGLLRKHGPSTATRLAERLEVNSGTASYHLRQLAAAGFVDEDRERGNARERWWRAVHWSTSFDIDGLAGEEPEATMTYLQSVSSAYALRSQHVLNEFGTMPRAWQAVYDMSDWLLRLTPEEAAELRKEMTAVVGRYRAETPEGAAAAEVPEDAERVSFILQVLPEPQVSDEEDASGEAGALGEAGPS